MVHDPHGLAKSLRVMAEASTALRPSLLSVPAGAAYAGSLLQVKESLRSERSDAMRHFLNCDHVLSAAADMLEHYASGDF